MFAVESGRITAPPRRLPLRIRTNRGVGQAGRTLQSRARPDRTSVRLATDLTVRRVRAGDPGPAFRHRDAARSLAYLRLQGEDRREGTMDGSINNGPGSARPCDGATNAARGEACAVSIANLPDRFAAASLSRVPPVGKRVPGAVFEVDRARGPHGAVCSGDDGWVLRGIG